MTSWKLWVDSIIYECVRRQASTGRQGRAGQGTDLDAPRAELLAEGGREYLDGVLGGGVGAAQRVAARDAGDRRDGDNAALALLDQRQEGLGGGDDAEEVDLGFVWLGRAVVSLFVCLFVRVIDRSIVRSSLACAPTSMQKRKSCIVNQSIRPERATPAVYWCMCGGRRWSASLLPPPTVLLCMTRPKRTGVVDEAVKALRVLLRHAVRGRLHLLRLGHVHQDGLDGLALFFWWGV